MDQREQDCARSRKAAISVDGPLSHLIQANGFSLIWEKIPKSPGLLSKAVIMPTGGPPVTHCPIKLMTGASSHTIMARYES